MIEPRIGHEWIMGNSLGLGGIIPIQCFYFLVPFWLGQQFSMML